LYVTSFTARPWGRARCAGLDDKVGSLAPGKEADLLMIRADDINLYPSNDARHGSAGG
jgi:imidazolonepropionase-like amidohydrolase